MSWAITLVLKMWICFSVIDILRNNLSIIGLSHLLIMYIFFSFTRNTRLMEKTLPSCTRYVSIETTHTHTHHATINYQHTAFIVAHIYPHLILIVSFQFPITLFPLLDNNSQAAIPNTSSTSKFHVFSRLLTHLL